MKNIKLFDVNFPHQEFTTAYQTSNKIKWDRNYSNNDVDDTVIITDNCMMSQFEFKGKKIGMIMEPRAINPYIYNFLSDKNNLCSFDKVLTYDKLLLDVSDKFEFYPHCGCWIQPEFQKLYNKTKLVSIIASSKRHTDGHRLRHNVIDYCKTQGFSIDSFGQSYQPITHKIEALKDYCFSIVIENSKQDYYFTEKLMDAFVTGTIPIYWGCPSIGDFFNLDGMIILHDINDLDNILNTLTIEKYNSILSAVKDNFEIAKKYLIVEDWLCL